MKDCEILVNEESKTIASWRTNKNGSRVLLTKDGN